MQLPSDFVALMREQLGEEQAEALFEGLQQEPTVAVRFNPRKIQHLALNQDVLDDPVPWCPDAYYLDGRRAFTFDPLFHAGAYYVQDASSMYLAEVLRRYGAHKPNEANEANRSYGAYETYGACEANGPLMALDLCAAPGGKSTLLATLLPEGSTLISNEPIRKRAQVLAENMQKWGREGCYVTNNYPRDFGHLRQTFDLILTDVPCSGEGMFRKDPVAVQEWSLQNVRQCVERQREILSDILPCLTPGGLLIYSTCTFNRYEDEEQVLGLQSEYGLTLLEERHFFPGRDRGEGLYMAALRRTEHTAPNPTFPEGKELVKRLKTLNVIADVAAHNRELSIADCQLELSYDDAIRYLRREALHINAPRGLVCVTYRGLPLGLAKSVGSRLNNLYPQEWRIRTTYSPTEPLPDFFLASD